MIYHEDAMGGSFEEDEEPIGRIQVRRNETEVIILMVYVEPRFRGVGRGQEMVAIFASIEEAKGNQITARCGFAKQHLKSH